MTPLDNIAALRGLVNRMRQGAQDEATIRAGLIAAGWTRESVTLAMMAAEDAQPMTRPGNVEHDT